MTFQKHDHRTHRSEEWHDKLEWVLGPESLRYESQVLRLVERPGVFPADGHEHLFTILEVPDWVNVIALTPDEQVLLVRQYRVGRAAITLEIPGGMMDPEDEDPVETGRRELLEETGYQADHYELIGTVEPNPALQTNRCHTILALDARLVQPQHLDPSERILVETLPMSEVRRALADGRIVHSLVIAAFVWYFGYGQDGVKSPKRKSSNH